MIEDTSLDDFQEALVALFARDLPPSETLRILSSDPAFAAHREWVRAFEPRLVEAASALARVWARCD